MAKNTKDSGKVSCYLKNLSNEEIMIKLQNNRLDFDLTKDEFNVNEVKEIDNYDTVISEDNQVLIYVNVEQNDVTNRKSIAKVLATKIQKMRKEVGLRPWNKIAINVASESQEVIDSYLEIVILYSI